MPKLNDSVVNVETSFRRTDPHDIRSPLDSQNKVHFGKELDFTRESLTLQKLKSNSLLFYV